MSRVKGLSGSRFGRWTVRDRAGTDSRGEVLWACICDCGAVASVLGSNLRTGRSKSCGCWRDAVARATRHGHARTRTGTGRVSPTYITWQAMVRRCTNPDASNFKYYGGRGVTVWPEWLGSFDVFLRDMGERPDGTSLDRIDPDGHYTPHNCRWATRSVQARNKSVA